MVDTLGRCSRNKSFTLVEFTPVNMKNCCCHNVRKHREIKNGEKYITLGISLKFGSMGKMQIKSLYPKDYFGISGKELITSLGHKTILTTNKKIEVCHY